MLLIHSQGPPFADSSNLAVNNPFNPAKGAVVLDDITLEDLSDDQLTLIDLDENDMRSPEDWPTENYNFLGDLHDCAVGYLFDKEFNPDKIYSPQEDQGDVVVGMEIIFIQGHSSIEDSNGDATTLSQDDPVEDNSTFDEITSADTLEHQNYIPQGVSVKLIFDGGCGNPNCIATAAELVHFFEEEHSFGRI
jgi:hypothetical protein